jgi:hypothetical protein
MWRENDNGIFALRCHGRSDSLLVSCHAHTHGNLCAAMTLDVLHFIDAKGGNAEEIRESQRKRGLSVELVDEVISMYNEWVKSACSDVSGPLILSRVGSSGF